MVNKILTQLEKIVYQLQKRQMKNKMTTELVGPHFAFFHPKDKSKQIISLHQLRLNKVLSKRITLVTGCFDILHQEHKKLLKKAKSQGDILVVGLESDERIKTLKGLNRPLHSWLIRRNRLLRLKEVDIVIELPVLFDQSKIRLSFLRLIKSDILAISSQDPLEKQKRVDCQKIGCQLKIVHQYNPKISTTKVLLTKTKKSLKW